MSYDPNGFAYIDQSTGQVKMEFEVYDRRAPGPPTCLQGDRCTMCRSSLDGNSTGGYVTWIEGLPQVSRFPEIGDPICRECELFAEHLHHYYEIGARTEFRFQVGDIVQRRGYEEYFRVVGRRHDGVKEIKTWWPVYACHVLEVNRGLLPRERRELELDFPDHELEKAPANALSDLTNPDAPPPPVRALEEAGRPPVMSLPDCDRTVALPFPLTRAIC